MRRLAGFLCLFLTLTACKRRPDKAPEEVPATLLSSFTVADPLATVQMTRGFYSLEGNAWRWAAPQFSVVLAKPAGATPLHLELKLTVPDAVLKETGPLTLTAKGAGIALPMKTYGTEGEQVYAADFTPAEDRAAYAFDFAVDKHVTPPGGDSRDLSLIVTSVGLTAK